jgi:hypothetical protein
MRDVISCLLAYSIASPAKQWNLISRICYKQMDNATNMATPHLLMKLDKQNMAKTSFKLAASVACGDVCAAECPVNGQKVLVVTVYVSPNTPSDEWKSLIFSNLAEYSPKMCMPIILAGDFKVNMKDIYNTKLVEFIKDTFELDVLSDLSQEKTRSNSCIDMVFGRNVDNLSCMNCVSYFSCLRPLLSRTNHQTPQLTDNNKLNALGNFNK